MLTVKNFDKSDIGEWEFGYLPEMGTLAWSRHDLGIHVYATPSYLEDDETPVEVYNELSGSSDHIMTLVHKAGSVEDKNQYVRGTLTRLMEKLEEMHNDLI